MTVRATSRIPLALALAVGAWVGCGERPDELGPYVERLQSVDQYNAQLIEYRQHLKADRAEQAGGVEETIQAYLAELETFGQIDNKAIMAGHNALKRDLEHALNKIVEPTFPTFTISALKQIDLILEGYEVHVNNLKKRWEEEERPQPFPLTLPEQEAG